MSVPERLQLPESRWADVDGPVHYRQWDGPGDGPAFVCVHGLGGSLLNFALVAPALARHGTTIALDLGGFGGTPPSGRDTDARANRRMLDGFLRGLDLPPVVLVGNSMGGMVSVAECANAPDRIQGMILVGAAFPRTNRLEAQFPPRVTALFGFYSLFRGVGTRMFDRRAHRLGAEALVRETLNLCTVDRTRVDPRLVEALIENTRYRQGLEYASKAFMDAAASIFNANVRPGRYRELAASPRSGAGDPRRPGPAGPRLVRARSGRGARRLRARRAGRRRPHPADGGAGPLDRGGAGLAGPNAAPRSRGARLTRHHHGRFEAARPLTARRSCAARPARPASPAPGPRCPAWCPSRP